MILLVNKIDRARPRERLLPFIEGRVGKGRVCRGAAGVGAQARRHRPPAGADREAICRSRRCSIHPDQLTDVSERFMAAEIIREKLTLRLQEELPYGLSVEIENMGPLEDEPGKRLVQAVIWVERTGQKAIVIGKGGELLKEIGRLARLELKRALRATGAPRALGQGQGRLVRQRGTRSGASGTRRERQRQTHPARAGLPAASLPVAGLEPHPRAADARARPR